MASVVRTNLLTNPAFRATSSTNVTRTNRAWNGAALVNLNGWAGGVGPVGNAVTTTRVVGGGPVLRGRTLNYVRVAFTAVAAGANIASTGPVYGSGGTDYLTVSAGVAFTHSVYARSSVADRTASLILTFTDNTGAAVGSTLVGPATAIGGTAWTRVSIQGTAPTGATRALMRVYSQAGANWQVGDTFDATGYLGEDADTVLDYFDGDSDVDPDTGWTTAWAGTAAASMSTESAPRVASGNATAYGTVGAVGGLTSSGVYRMVFKRNVASGNVMAFHTTTDIPIVGGTFYAARWQARLVPGSAASATVSPRLARYDPSYVTASIGPSAALRLDGGWTDITVPCAAAEASGGTAPTARVMLYSVGVIPAGTEIEMRNVIVEAVSGVGAVPGDYFDGSYASGDAWAYAWTGAANASTSTFTYNPATPPDVRVFVCFDSTAFQADVPTDVSDRVRSVSIKRGRNMELDNFEAGSISVTFDNNDGYFTPRMTPNAGQPALRPKRAVYVQAFYKGAWTTIGYSIVERWPAGIGNSDLTVTIPATDAFKLLTETALPDSDTGFTPKFNPTHYFPLSDNDASQGLVDLVTKRKARVFWASPFSLNDAQYWATSQSAPLPTVNYGAGSVFTSGNGASVDMGGYWNNGGVHGAWALNFDSLVRISPNESGGGTWSFSVAFTLPVMSHPDGSDTAILSIVEPSLSPNGGYDPVPFLTVKPDGSVVYRFLTVAPAGTIKAMTPARITFSRQVSGAIAYAWMNVNGVEYSMPNQDNTISDRHNSTVWYIGGDNGLGGRGAGARFADLGVWNRALTLNERNALWGDYLVGPGLTSDTRINRLLDLIGWPTAKRDLQVGKSALARRPFSDNTSVLSLLQAWANADGGLVYMGKDGSVVYRNRHDRIKSAPTPSYTFDCNAATGVEEGLEWVMSEDDIVNAVTLTYATGGEPVTIRDNASVAEFGEKPANVSPDVLNNDEARAAADWMLLQYSQPIIRVSQVTIYPSAGEGTALWDAAVGAEIGQVIRLANLPANAPASTMDYVIESVTHDIERDGSVLIWQTSFDVSPLPLAAWVLGDAVVGVLGSTTRLTY